MNEPVNYSVSFSSEQIRSRPGYLMGIQVTTSGSPLSAAPAAAASVGWFDGTSVNYAMTLSHARVPSGYSYNWSPPWPLPFSQLWIEIFSGSPIVTTSWL